MPSTPSRGYTYPTTSSPATVPADLRVPLEQVDADVQTITDELAGRPTHPEVLAVAEAVAAAAVADVELTAETVARAAGHVLHVGEIPPASDTMYGVPVVWIDTRSRSAWHPAAPGFDLTGRTFTIPTDEGATYYLDGALVPAGTYPVVVPEGGETVVTVSAAPVAGYTFAESATAGWQVTYEDVVPAYDVAALAGRVPEYYYRLDDAFPAAPRNRGTGTLEEYWAPGTETTVGPGIGVGATSLGSSFRFLIRHFWDRPVTALTVAAVVQTSEPGSLNEGVRVATGPTARSLLYANYLSGRHQIGWAPLDGSPARTVDSPVAPGAIVHLATVWDGETQIVYVDGVQVDSLEVAEIEATAVPTDDGRATLASGQRNTPIAGLVLDTVARDSAWVAALSASVAR